MGKYFLKEDASVQAEKKGSVYEVIGFFGEKHLVPEEIFESNFASALREFLFCDGCKSKWLKGTMLKNNRNSMRCDPGDICPNCGRSNLQSVMEEI